jgi:8-oxo-dGTP diphosphatase
LSTITLSVATLTAGKGSIFMLWNRTVLTADVVLFTFTRRAPHVLLIQRGHDPFRGRWALPGGHVEPGEYPIAAALRELREETGIELAAAEPVGIYDTPGRDPRGPVTTHAFTALVGRPYPLRAGDDAADAGWFRLDVALGDMPLAFDHAQIVGAAADAHDLT